MIDIIRQQINDEMTDELKLNKTREVLQIILLKILYDKDYLNNLAFLGGTALRILYDLRRFSEDLDFSLVNKKEYAFSRMNSELLGGINLYGLRAESKVKEKNNVKTALLKFGGLLKALGLSKLEDQKLSIKIDVDTNPPRGWRIENTIINKLYMLNVVHFDLASSYATKLHACFYRKYTKGRDFYDFIWYLGQKVRPNYVLLDNAITQTEGSSPKVDESNFKQFLLDGIERVDFAAAKKDVDRFLEDKSELRLFDVKAMRGAIESAY